MAARAQAPGPDRLPSKENEARPRASIEQSNTDPETQVIRRLDFVSFQIKCHSHVHTSPRLGLCIVCQTSADAQHMTHHKCNTFRSNSLAPYTMITRRVRRFILITHNHVQIHVSFGSRGSESVTPFKMTTRTNPHPIIQHNLQTSIS